MSTLTLVQGLLATAVLVGLVWRRRLHLAWSFALYILSIAVYDALIGLWPDHFKTWGFWLTGEGTHAVLKVAMVLELSGLIFSAFPAARRSGRLGLFLILGATVVSIAALQPTTVSEGVRVALPRAQYGAAYLFAWLLAVVLWYRIPLHFLHKAILMALVPYLVVFSLGIHLLEMLEWSVWPIANQLNVLAFIGVLLVWLWAAWRPEPAADVPPAVVKTVQPWA